MSCCKSPMIVVSMIMSAANMIYTRIIKNARKTGP